MITCRRIAKEHGCRIVYDRRHHWRESGYYREFRKLGPTILIGGAGDPLDCCSVLLHELGHHILHSKNQHPGEVISGEQAAWRVAHRLAQEHRLAVRPDIRREGLSSYRHAQRLEATAGSKNRNPRRRLPRSWRLEGSQRSATVHAGWGHYCTGKKGKRHAKRIIKRATAKAERRKTGPPE
ncbi:MAG: hypothetical protein GF355_01240 [Candidatus Eisenbacteria bacterium]|nr:hypothetical protein [Candidatus Eisenbacteria bacterium]